MGRNKSFINKNEFILKTKISLLLCNWIKLILNFFITNLEACINILTF